MDSNHLKRLFEGDIFLPGAVIPPGTPLFAPHNGVMKSDTVAGTTYVPSPLVIVTCACKRTYTREEWSKLKYVGLLDKDDEGDELLEMRNCVCGSTRSAEREK